MCALVTEGKRDPSKACVQDLMFMSRLDRNLGVAFQTHLGVRPRLEGKQRTPLSSRVATRVSWSPLSGLKGGKPPLVFGGRTRDCSPGNAGNEGPHLEGKQRTLLSSRVGRVCLGAH